MLAGRYRLRDVIGTGAMGTVWRARDELLDRDVAVKEVLIPPAFSSAERDAAYQRTLREARTAARLSHPGVVTVFDVVEEGERPWIVMELVHARSLDRVLAEDGPMAPARAAAIGHQLVGALATAHAAGVLHRDVKPSNVLLAPDGRAVLTDFGIATFEGDAQLTQTGMVMGTPAFTPPERIRGEPATPASDLWSLGATLFAAVQGRGPFHERGGALTTMNAVLHEDAPAAPAAAQLGPVIAALMRRDPASRPDAVTAAQMLSAAAGGALADGSPPGGMTTLAGPERPPAASGPGPVWAGAAASPSARRPEPAPPGAGFAYPAPTAWDQMSPPGGAWAPDTGWPPAGSVPPAAAHATTRPAPGPTSPGYPRSSPATPGPPPPGYPRNGPAAPGGTRYGAPVGGVPPYRPGGPGAGPRGPGGRGTAGVGAAGASGAGRPDPTALTRARPTRRSRNVGLLAGAAAVVVIGGLLAGYLVKHAARNSGATTSGQSQSVQGSHHGHGHATAPTTSRTSPSPKPSGARTPTPPPGYQWYTRTAAAAGSAAGFRMAVPQGWTSSAQGLVSYLRAPSGGAFMEVDLTQQAFPNPVTQAHWLQARTRHQGKFPGYHLISIKPATLLGTNAAIWTFSWNEPGVGRVTAQDTLFDLSTAGATQSYAIYGSAPTAAWPQAAQQVDEGVTTFRPLT